MLIPSLHATYSGMVSHLSLSVRSHSQVPPVWESREAWILLDMKDREWRETHVDCNNVCHGGEGGEPGTNLSKDGAIVNLILLRERSAYCRSVERYYVHDRTQKA